MTNLEVLLAVEDNGFRLHFTIFNVDFVATQNNWNIVAHANQIAMPVWYVFVCDTSGDVEHDDRTLACHYKNTSSMSTCEKQLQSIVFFLVGYAQ